MQAAVSRRTAGHATRGAASRRDAFWVLECSSACSFLARKRTYQNTDLRKHVRRQGTWRLSGGIETLMYDDGWHRWSFAFAGQPAVNHPVTFRWLSSSKKNRPSWCIFLFQMAPVLPLRTSWIADILSQESLRGLQRQRRWKRGCGDGRRGAESVGIRRDCEIFQCRFSFVRRRWKARFDAHLNR